MHRVIVCDLAPLVYYVSEELYVLVYWEEEDAVFVVAAHRVEGEPKQGEVRKVKIEKEIYTGKVASTGEDLTLMYMYTYTYTLMHVCIICCGDLHVHCTCSFC